MQLKKKGKKYGKFKYKVCSELEVLRNVSVTLVVLTTNDYIFQVLALEKKTLPILIKALTIIFKLKTD